jgi:hypothetical protein
MNKNIIKKLFCENNSILYNSYNFNSFDFKNTKSDFSKFKKQKHLLSFQKKGIYSKFKGYYDDIKLNINEKKDTNEWIKLQDPIYFENKKYLILQSEPSYKRSVLLLKNYIIRPILIMTGTCSLWLFYNKRILSTIFCSLIYLFFSRLNKGLNMNNKKVIDKIYLLENGTEIQVETFDKDFKTDIKNVRKLELEEGLYLSNNLDAVNKTYVPISINRTLYLIPKNSINYNKEILNAISNGKYIKLDECIKDENSIDIDYFDYSFSKDKDTNDFNINNDLKNDTIIDIDTDVNENSKKDKSKI